MAEMYNYLGRGMRIPNRGNSKYIFCFGISKGVHDHDRENCPGRGAGVGQRHLIVSHLRI